MPPSQFHETLPKSFSPTLTQSSFIKPTPKEKRVKIFHHRFRSAVNKLALKRPHLAGKYRLKQGTKVHSTRKTVQTIVKFCIATLTWRHF